MQTCHGLWLLDGRFALWGERRPLPDISQPSPQEESTGPSVQEHTFALEKEELDTIIDALEFDAGEHGAITLALPTCGFTPLHSQHYLPNLFSAKALSELEPVLGFWRVPVAFFDALGTAAFLTSLPSSPGQQFKFSQSLTYWVEVMKFVLELLCHGKLLPTMEASGSALLSRWATLPLEEKDRNRVVKLASSMPPACRAFVEQQPWTPEEPSVLLESFISQVSDSLIRSFLRHSTLLPEEQSRFLSPRTKSAFAWLTSLREKNPKIDGTEIDLSELNQRLRRWASPLITEKQADSLQLTLHVRAPDPQSKQTKWRVEFAISAIGSARKQVSARDVWQGNYDFLSRGELTGDDIEETLLRLLGRAALSAPSIRNSLNTSHPVVCELSTREIYGFLREEAPELERDGVNIVLPEWWNQRSSKVGLKLTVNPQKTASNNATSFLGFNELFDYSWEIAIGDKVLPLEEFRKLINSQGPLVYFGDRWVELNPRRVQATLEFFDQMQSRPQLTGFEALRYGLGAEKNNEIFDVIAFESSGWLDRFLSREKYDSAPVEQAKEFKGELRPYQLEGLRWLNFLGSIGIGCCLADDMGLGKTIQLLALEALEREHLTAEQRKPTLIVLPMSIMENWRQEAERFTPKLRVLLHHGTDRPSTPKSFTAKANSVDLVLTTYALAQRDSALLEAQVWKRIVLDEAQNIKNLFTKQTQALRRLVQLQTSADGSVRIPHRIALSGTPLENRLDELWSILDFLNPGYLGSLQNFRSTFAIPIERYRDQAAADRLSKIVRPFLLRRLKSDPRVVSDLPEKIEMEVITPLSDEQAALYQKVLESMLPQVDEAQGMHRKGLVLATITKLKQICDHPALFLKQSDNLAAGRSGKLDRLRELLEVFLSAGDKALIFSQFATMGSLLEKYLRQEFDREVLFLHGGVPRKARSEMIERFQSSSGPPIFVLSLKAGGFGLNLTEANQVIHYDQWWNPAVEEQASDRAHRIGQKRTVQIRRFLCRGTLEERIAEMLARKREMIDQVVGSAREAVTQLSTDELKQLLQLREEG